MSAAGANLRCREKFAHRWLVRCRADWSYQCGANVGLSARPRPPFPVAGGSEGFGTTLASGGSSGKVCSHRFRAFRWPTRSFHSHESTSPSQGIAVFAIAVILSILVCIVLIISIIGAIYLVLGMLFLLFLNGTFSGGLRGNAVRVSAKQLTDVDAISRRYGHAGSP
jgi:hypothetical protein